MTDPLAQIEDEKSHRDMGALVARFYAGAREESSFLEAFWATVAFVIALMMSKPEMPE